MGYRYIGSKARIADDIIGYLGQPSKSDGVFVDAFSGTGIVASRAADSGWRITINDVMKNATVMSEAYLLAKNDVPFINIGGYLHALEILNNAALTEGFIWREYSPASVYFSGIERKYFTEVNAQKIDGIVKQIQEWLKQRLITRQENVLLMATLISATNNVANIAGTYGCFLSKWTAQSKRYINMEALTLRNQPVDYRVYNLDVFNLTSEENDVVYFDPPYTKRQYASYYHILETIVNGDCPVVSGTAGLRPWKDKASIFCYKLKALKALVRLVTEQKAHRILISYSNDGHINLEELTKELKSFGDVKIVSLREIGSYRPNIAASNRRSEVEEYLIDFRH